MAYEETTEHLNHVYSTGDRQVARRDLLRTTVGIMVGAGLGAKGYEVTSEVADIAEGATGLKSGNGRTTPYQNSAVAGYGASGHEIIETKERIELDPSDITYRQAVYVGMSEEFAFRLLPSFFGGENDEEEEMVVGMSRREVIAGALSSLYFGVHHNLLPSEGRFRTDILPLHQTTMGFAWWWMQRRFGYVANATSHAVNNVSALRKVKQRSLG